MTSSNGISVLLVDDHPVFRAGLRAMLEAEDDMVVVGEAPDGETAIRQVRALEPDVTIMDLSLPGVGGLEATRRIVEIGVNTKILVLTMHTEEEYLFPVLDAGASGYVTKTAADRELITAIRTVAAGDVFLYPHAASLLLGRYKTPPGKDSSDPLYPLTQRERDVLTLTASGYSSTDIGRKLFISPKTVDTYRARVMHKLNLSHRSELVHFALRTGLLKPNSPP